MRNITAYFLFISLCVISISCSGHHSNDPVQTGAERNIETFLPVPVMLFGGDYSSTFPESVYCEVDIGGIDILSPDSGYSGQPYNYDGWGTAVVTMMRDENDATAPFKPVARWVSDTSSALSEPFYVTGWEDTLPNHEIWYRHPKCIATHYSTIGYNIPYVELFVTYQISGVPDENLHGLNGSDWTDTNEGEWDIGATLITWELDDFPDPDYAVREDFILPEDRPDRPWDDYDPDIAYDSFTGDIYLVYSDFNTPHAVETATIKYVVFEREGDFGIRLAGWANDTFWDAGYPRQIPFNNEMHGGWDPCVAVGTMDLFVGGLINPWINSTNPFIVISYTAQYDDQTGYHVNIASWQLEEPLQYQHYLNRVVQPIRHPIFGHEDAGLSSVSITPNSSDRHYGALVFTQVTGEDQYGPVLTSFYIDSFNLTNLKDPDSFLELTTAQFADNLYPSITIHETNSTSNPDDYTSNVIWMAQDAEMDTWHPSTSEVTTTVSWPPLTAAMQLNFTQVLYQANSSYFISGNFNPAQIPFIVPGMSTSIRSTSTNDYWAAWCNQIEMEPPAEVVYGTFGHSTN